MKEINLKTKGMHCHSCEMLIEQNLLESGAVTSAKADWKTQSVQAVYDETKIDPDQMNQRIKSLGFGIDSEELTKKKTINKEAIIEFLYAFIIFAVIYIIANMLNLGERFTIGLSEFSISTAFLVGITAGVSTCMALVGGLVLGLSANYNQEHPEAGAVSKMKPHIFFNIGRIAGFWLLGGVLGLFGSLFSISAGFTGLFTIAVAILMLLMGLKLTGLIPFMNNFQFSLPKRFGKKISVKETGKSGYSYRKTLIIGALTFFLPCGFTQMMQTFAVSTGDFWQSGAIMGAFALGTVPGLFGIGAITAFIKGRTGSILFRVTGLVLIVFAIYNFSNGYNLSRSLFTVKNEAVTEKEISAVIQEVQTVELLTTYTLNDDIVPNQFKVKSGQKIRLIIDVKENGQGCMSAIMISGVYDDARPLIKGKLVLEFTPVSKGVFPITCAMGMERGSLTVE